MDEIEAGYGNDTINTTDGQVDLVRCGPGKDTVYADQSDININLPECEKVYPMKTGAGGEMLPKA